MIDRFFHVSQSHEVAPGPPAAEPAAVEPAAGPAVEPAAAEPAVEPAAVEPAVEPAAPAVEPAAKQGAARRKKSPPKAAKAKAQAQAATWPVDDPAVAAAGPRSPSKAPHSTPRGADTKRRKTPEPGAACGGVGTSYAAFTPLRRDVNEPQPADDPFGESFAAACEEDWWQYEDEEQASAEEREQQLEDDAESWAYDSVDTAGLSDDEEEVVSSSPTRAGEDPFHSFLQSRRRRFPKEHKAVYTGPQLVLDDDDD
jgi:hypothetical protein